MPDMRDELVERAIPAVFVTSCVLDTDDARTVAADVLDSIPPGSFKLDEKTWVKLVRVSKWELLGATVVALFTEVDHAE